MHAPSQTKKPKVLALLHLPPPVNGASMVGQFIAESTLINTDFEVDYINLGTSKKLEALGKGGLQKLWAFVWVLFAVLRAITTKKYKLTYVTVTAKGIGFYKDFLLVLLLKMTSSKLVYHFHNKGVAGFSKRKLHHWMYTFLFKNASVILLSELLYTDVSKYVQRDNLFICANGVPTTTIEAVITASTTKKLNFFFLSNMMEEKGVYLILKAAALLKNTNFECHFVGAWSDITAASFDAKVNALGINHLVRMHGKKYGVEKHEFFSEADVFLFPTFYHNECFPLVLLEAMQYQLPIITTIEGAISEMVVHDWNGLHVPQKDATALAKAMQFYIENPAMIAKMGLNGKRHYTTHYTLLSFEERMHGIWTTIVNT